MPVTNLSFAMYACKVGNPTCTELTNWFHWVLTCLSSEDVFRSKGVDGKHQPVVVVAHGVAGQMPRITKGREFFFRHSPSSLGLVAYDVGRHEVEVIEQVA